MKTILTFLLFLFPSLLYSQTYNTTINKANNVTVAPGSSINIKQGNVVIGKIIINEEANKWKNYLDTVTQFKDEYEIWHTILVFKTLENTPLFSTAIMIECDTPFINVIQKTCCLSQSKTSINKKAFKFISNQQMQNPFSFIVNSAYKIKVKLSGVLPKP